MESVYCEVWTNYMKQIFFIATAEGSLGSLGSFSIKGYKNNSHAGINMCFISTNKQAIS